MRGGRDLPGRPKMPRKCKTKDMSKFWLAGMGEMLVSLGFDREKVDALAANESKSNPWKDIISAIISETETNSVAEEPTRKGGQVSLGRRKRAADTPAPTEQQRAGPKRVRRSGPREKNPEWKPNANSSNTYLDKLRREFDETNNLSDAETNAFLQEVMNIPAHEIQGVKAFFFNRV